MFTCCSTCDDVAGASDADEFDVLTKNVISDERTAARASVALAAASSSAADAAPLDEVV
jgi:hypothetical protein